MATGEAAPLLPLGGLTFITFSPTGAQSPVTVPPIQIFNWTSQSRAEFLSLASAAIAVLLVILLAMSSPVIWLRNHFSRRWRGP
jgi:phosphate transport system permease protein